MLLMIIIIGSFRQKYPGPSLIISYLGFSGETTAKILKPNLLEALVSIGLFINLS